MSSDKNVVELDSDNSDEERRKPAPAPVVEKRIAKKSTATSVVDIKQTAAVTRRQVALANKEKQDRFLENFDPESSARERRKLTRKVNQIIPTRRIPGALFDEYGVHIVSGVDLCDCLQKSCPGCHFPCPKCKSQKCGPECRCNRKYIYDQIEYHGCDLVVKNPLSK
ncbi:hypothetical protein PPYR_01929 [Photinus pyralis]|uniref:ARF7 effector protein C-terminal domain-containing protein n=1 Tax=Photinus pyralis TaxID=7054 RepID=A0A1Y1KQN6_PHOPY|nr:ARL14 effector protein-like [Photinus pyralis]KAB0804959.1 hypothetical protein PPYR_01929 [Photinus pyralis]